MNRSTKRDGGCDRRTKRDGGCDRRTKRDGGCDRRTKRDGGCDRRTKRDGGCDRRTKRDGGCDRRTKRDGGCDRRTKRDGGCDRRTKRDGGCDRRTKRDGGCDRRTKRDGGCDRRTKRGREELPHVRAQGQKPREPIPEGRWPRGVTPRPRISILFSIMPASVYIPINSLRRFLFSTSSPAFICRFFDDGHSELCEDSFLHHETKNPRLMINPCLQVQEHGISLS
ncbi:uncharacterized protein LOC129640096 [Bubalus kerabau]|uniref:uncharacterized protein LOC129640096 n=1 Tax=Bubalus carabanensis TaxID=3119969 RepID=UPI00244E9866|nr:uncharacterized protein LOC129640096 [Bubalus carabanensis]